METTPNSNSIKNYKSKQQSYIFLAANKGSLKKVTLFYSCFLQEVVLLKQSFCAFEYK